MDAETIMGLEGRELDAAVAAVAGATWEESATFGRRLFGMVALLATVGVDGVLVAESVLPRYHSSLDAIRPVVEKCVEELGGIAVQVNLREVMEYDYAYNPGKPLWNWLALPDQFARAVLLANITRDATTEAAESVGAKRPGIDADGKDSQAKQTFATMREAAKRTGMDKAFDTLITPTGATMKEEK